MKDRYPSDASIWAGFAALICVCLLAAVGLFHTVAWWLR